MIADIQIIGILLVTVAGSVMSSLLGWADSGGVFNARKFIPSMIRAAIAVIITVLVSDLSLTNVELEDYIFAFFTGAGIDALGNRLSGSLTGSSQSTTSTTPAK